MQVIGLSLGDNLAREPLRETTFSGTFNIVQENLMKGGIRGQKRVEVENTDRFRIHRTTTRKIKAIDKDMKVNKSLWNLTEKMKELKLTS